MLKNVRSGSIILFHNAAEHTPEALPGIIEALQADGYTIVPVSQILLTGDTYQDNTGRQWQKERNQTGKWPLQNGSFAATPIGAFRDNKGRVAK